MSREEIIKRAQVSGLWDMLGSYSDEFGNADVEKDCLASLLSFAGFIASAERERFADECIDIVARWGGSVEIEAAIRARGETK